MDVMPFVAEAQVATVAPVSKAKPADKTSGKGGKDFATVLTGTAVSEPKAVNSKQQDQNDNEAAAENIPLPLALLPQQLLQMLALQNGESTVPVTDNKQTSSQVATVTATNQGIGPESGKTVDAFSGLINLLPTDAKQVLPTTPQLSSQPQTSLVDSAQTLTTSGSNNQLLVPAVQIATQPVASPNQPQDVLPQVAAALTAQSVVNQNTADKQLTADAPGSENQPVGQTGGKVSAKARVSAMFDETTAVTATGEPVGKENATNQTQLSITSVFGEKQTKDAGYQSLATPLFEKVLQATDSQTNNVVPSAVVMPEVSHLNTVATVHSTEPGQALPQPAQADPYNIAGQIIDNARLINRTNNSEMVIRLKPEHLGELTLKVVVENGTVSAAFHAANPEVRSAIEASLPQLRQDMSNQGLKVDYVGVYASLDQFNPNQQRQSPQQQVLQVKTKAKDDENFVEAVEAAEAIANTTSATGVDYRI